MSQTRTKLISYINSHQESATGKDNNLLIHVSNKNQINIIYQLTSGKRDWWYIICYNSILMYHLILECRDGGRSYIIIILYI